MKSLSNHFLPVIFVLLAIFLSYFSIKNQHLVKEKNQQIEKLQELDAEKQYVIENLAVISKLQYFAEGKIVKDILLYKENKDSISLGKLLSENPKLIYYFSEQSCTVCSLPFLKKVSELAGRIGKEQVIVIGKFQNHRSYQSFLQENAIGLEVFRIDRDLDIFPEYNDYAMAFMLSDNRIIDKLIIVDKTNVLLSDNYLKLVEKYFFK
ncbi:MAG: hypothetical protein E7085_04800 [Parabacteroides distasonis]|nr:hypothetical protein [Parabacteroides distasonis]